MSEENTIIVCTGDTTKEALKQQLEQPATTIRKVVFALGAAHVCNKLPKLLDVLDAFRNSIEMIFDPIAGNINSATKLDDAKYEIWQFSALALTKRYTPVLQLDPAHETLRRVYEGFEQTYKVN